MRLHRCRSRLPYPAPQDTPAVSTSGKASNGGGGKCASGKCGSEKIYSKADVKQDANGQLVRARDGICGLSGQGYNVAQTDRDRMAQGVCSR